ncbi:MAG: phosphoribosylanthranilate isomerase [Gammaproteobacteria bacterium]|nr:phosphoribosylanthranilate isomerase [Gammaproteobacteria bacterium]
MQKTWIKICGITRAQDALAAADLGANAIGVVLYAKSPRAVAVADLADIVAKVPKRVTVVALFVNPEADLVRQVLATKAIDLLQFHGVETAEFCEQFNRPYMKAIAVSADSDLKSALASYGAAQYILLDSYDPIMPGGTGKTFDWDKVGELTEQQQARLVLAGGLAPANVREAIETVHPFGVDVSSGVEASKGIKDIKLMQLFIEGVRASG